MNGCFAKCVFLMHRLGSLCSLLAAIYAYHCVFVAQMGCVSGTAVCKQQNNNQRHHTLERWSLAASVGCSSVQKRIQFLPEN